MQNKFKFQKFVFLNQQKNIYQKNFNEQFKNFNQSHQFYSKNIKNNQKKSKSSTNYMKIRFPLEGECRLAAITSSCDPYKTYGSVMLRCPSG